MVSRTTSPTVRTAVLRVLNTFKRVGTESQKTEAAELEQLLNEQPLPEAVSFATAEDEKKPEGKQ